MTDTSRNLLVGSFVIASLLVLALLLAWFGEAPSWLGGNEWTLRIVGVRNLSGIEPGSPVRLNGVEIGRVRRLDFADGKRPDAGVVVFAGIRDEYTVPSGARARVYGPTLGLGTGNVDIVVPAGASLEPLARDNSPQIPGDMRDKLAEILPRETLEDVAKAFVNVGDFAAAATPAAKNLGAILAPTTPPESAEHPGEANLYTAVHRLDELIRNLNDLVADPAVQGDVRAVVGDVRAAIADLRGSVDSFRTSADRIAGSFESGVGDVTDDLDRSFVSLNRVLDRLDESATNLASVTHDVAEGRGTLGLLVNDPRLYEAAVLSAERLADSLATLQVILGKIEADGYITVGKAPTGILKRRIPIPESQVAAP